MTSFQIKNAEGLLTRKISNELEKDCKQIKNHNYVFLFN